MHKVEFPTPDALGTAKFLINLNKKKEANTALDLILPYCISMEQLDAIGYLYTKNRNFLRSIEVANKMLLVPNLSKSILIDINTNLLRSYLNSNQPYEAIRVIKYLETLGHRDQTTDMDMAYALFLLNRKSEGEKLLREIEKSPNTNDLANRCTFNLASYDLINGDFKKGVKEFLLAGRKMEIWQEFDIPNSVLWTGQPIPQGSTVVLCAEGGIGDEIINIRFCRHLIDLGINPIWYTTREDLRQYFELSGYNTISSIKNIPKEWYWTYSMLLPCYLDVEESDLWHGAYLKVPDSINIPKSIGIKYSGNPEYDQDLARSLPLNKLLQAIPEDYTIYSFHKDEYIDHPRVINWMSKNTTWEETFNMLQSMELVISSCTSLIHAAGSIDKKSIVFAPILKYYLWGGCKEHSPWYSDNLTVLHQTEYGTWDMEMDKLRTLI